MFPRPVHFSVSDWVSLSTLIASVILATTPIHDSDPRMCAALEDLKFPEVIVTSTEYAPADLARGWPDHCVARGVIDGQIRFVLHLPAPDVWNGRFLMGGGGGFGGVVLNQALTAGLPGGDALQRGYATIGTDTGHRGRGPSPTLDASWAIDNWSALVDFGYRAVHRTATWGKNLTEQYYGQAPRRSYFFGCSNGGRQGLMEAQRYPYTFDGIVAGAPALDMPGMIIHFVTIANAMFPDGDPEQPVLSEDRVRNLHEAVLAACDSADGLQDSLISDPDACAFDLRLGLTEFSDAEIRAIEAVYNPLRVGGRLVHPGYPPGHEGVAGAWDLRVTGHARPGGPINYAATEQFVGGIILNDPSFRLSNPPPVDELLSRADLIKRVLNATSPDLRGFEEAGGKLIMYHGWADHGVSAYSSTDYHSRVIELFGDQDQIDDFFRLFMLPGMSHCTGGEGPDRVDWLTALERWVEEGIAPTELIAEKVMSDQVLISRPVCPHPQRAVYHGRGDVNHHTSFGCRDRQ